MILDEAVTPVPDGPDRPVGDVEEQPEALDNGGIRGELVLVQRCAWTLVWLGVLDTALGFWGSWPAGWWAAILSPLLVLVGLAGLVLVWAGRRPLSTAMQRFGLVAGLVAVGVSEGTAIHLRNFYATDSAAFNQVATRLFLDGKNPYTASMGAAANLLHPAADFWTYQVDGAHTLKVSYPAGSFLLQAPFMGLGLNHMISDWVDLGAWLVTAVLIFVMVPPVLRWLAPLVLMTGTFLVPFSSGGTDALFVPFLVIAVWRWDRFPGRAVGWLPAWVGPASLGIACSIKQTPWFCVPFLMVGVACEARRAGGRPLPVALRYGAITAVTFVVVNAPFIVWNPAAWLRGIFLPMIDPLVADGQGIVAIALHGLTGGVVLPWLSVAAALALVAMVLAFFWWEPRLRRAWLFLVPLVLFVPARSLANYLSDFVPAALVAALSVAALKPSEVVASSVEPSAASAGRRWWPRLSVGVPAVAAVALVAVAFTSAPLDVSVDRVVVAGVATVEGGQNFRLVEVTVHNRSDVTLSPHFMVSSGGGHPSAFWRSTVIRGDDPVRSGASTVFVIRPPSWFETPAHGQWWLVAAYTTPPNALSTSPLQYWRLGKPAP